VRKTLIVLLCLLLSGCWDYKDLNKLSIVTGMAFDQAKDGKLKVTLEIVDRSSSPKKEGLRTRSVEVTEKNAKEAVQKAARGLDFELYYGALAVVIFGDGVKEGELLDWLHDNREVRETVYIVRAEKAGKKLQTEEDGGIAAYMLRDILDASEDAKPLELYRCRGG
jgi:spore germination protein KC